MIADNASLNQILREISRADRNQDDGRSRGRARVRQIRTILRFEDVLNALLDGTGSNMLLIHTQKRHSRAN